eukprot:CAMPEP_0179331882 /NCGR_PEP_ID=MMETSP0797-20121207/64427_1 /TAXON_ID=47934 /ORGANISM="Dinophysis acuminata, Strain DAEP01" /LENGTH=54 /DNA_ID=CAMNT_0021044693 /DNA_START=278 /DNA_END=438 /DNA_ORIENTATION=+
MSCLTSCQTLSATFLEIAARIIRPGALSSDDAETRPLGVYLPHAAPEEARHGAA